MRVRAVSNKNLKKTTLLIINNGKQIFPNFFFFHISTISDGFLGFKIDP
jgi:hypothetical protein